MRLLPLLPLTLAIACTPKAFTPSARPLPLGPAQAPARGEHDVQLEGNASGEIFGPGILSGNVRYRRGVTDQVAITGDLGLLRVDNEAAAENPYAGLARVGVHVHGPATDELVAAAFAGVGGGYAPAAGGWASGDIGGMFTGTHRYIRPTLLVEAYAAQPFATQAFAAEDTMLRLPRTYGVQGVLGFDLGPRDRAFLIGLAVSQLWASANDLQEATSAQFIGLGGGLRFGAN